MQIQDLEKLKSWFFSYIESFYGDDELINEMIKLKGEHTKRVCFDMGLICNRCQLDDEQKFMAQVVGLLHDLGRFEQIKKYQTFNDFESVNHSGLAIRVLRDKKLLDSFGFSSERQKIIEKAIAMHAKKQLPENIAEDAVLYAKLIRDADKLDIYAVMIEKMADYRKRPEKYTDVLGFPDEPRLSKFVVDAVLNDRRVAYAELETMSDMILIQMGWVVDINFVATLELIKERRLLELTAEFLPDVPEADVVLRHCLKYMNEKITRG